MRTRILIIIGIVFGGLIVTNQQYADGICVRNQDWPGTPCYAPFPTNHASHMDMVKQDWEKYYDFKGSEFMEQKKSEMLFAFNNGTLDEWIVSGNRDEHSNVYNFYFLQGVIPDENNGEYFEDKKQRLMMEYYFEHLAEGNIPIGNIFVSLYLFVIIGILSVTIFAIVWRKRK